MTFADTAMMRLHYHEAGSGDETVVMLHGGGPGASAWSNFGPNLPEFAKSFRTLMLDQPGFGSSAAPPVTGHYFTFAAAALASLLDHLGIEKVHLIGNSLGGGTAVRFALDYPDRAGRLVLMGPGGLSLNVFAPDPTEGVKALIAFAAPPGPSKDKLAAFLRTLVFNPKLVTDELIEERYRVASTPESLAAMTSMGASFFDPATPAPGQRPARPAQVRCQPRNRRRAAGPGRRAPPRAGPESRPSAGRARPARDRALRPCRASWCRTPARRPRLWPRSADTPVT